MYYGLNFELKYMPGNMYFNGFLMGLADILAIIIIWVSLIFTNSIYLLKYGALAIAILSIPIFWLSDFLQIFIIFLVRANVSIVFWSSYYANMEFFTPSILSKSYGLCNVVARLMAVLSPIMIEIVPHPLVIFLVISCCLFIFSFLRKYEN